MEKRLKNEDNKSKKKKKRNLVRNYLGNSQQNCCMVGEKESMKGKGKRGGTKTGVNGKIPRNEET